MLERGTSSIPILSRMDVLSKKFEFKRYAALSGNIRAYRNVIVHSWHSFQIDYSVPKRDYVKSYRDWARVTDVIKSNNDQAKQELLTKHFVPMREFIQEEVDQLIKVVNVLWSEIIALIPECATASLATINLQVPVAHHAFPHAAPSGTMFSSDFLKATNIDIAEANIQLPTKPE